MSQRAKLQRWIDLVSTLLASRYGVSLAHLRGQVPGYGTGSLATVRRSFERDKEELRALGVPIETQGADGDAESRYRIDGTRFYLPYLALVTPRGVKQPRRVDRYGYRALRDCNFTDAELHLLADAAARVTALGDPVLAADARHALAKLAVDVPPETARPAPGVAVVAPHTPSDPETLSRLSEALLRRKQVTFTYYGIERNETERRTVFAYGLTFTGGHWYLHGQDAARAALRRFRVSRIRELAVNPKSPGSQDYEIPASFRLADRAAVVPPWQLGEDAATTAVLRFVAETGTARAARRLGKADAADPRLVQFTVRRREPFLRWVLGLAGDAVPVAPPDIVREFRALVERTEATTGGAK